MAECDPLVISHWIPHVLIWIMSIPYTAYLTRGDITPRNNAYWIIYTIRTLLPLPVLIALLGETMFNVTNRSENKPVTSQQVIAAVTNITSHILTTLVMAIELRKGVHPSLVPLVSWFSLLCSQVGPLQVIFLQNDNREEISTFTSEPICIPRVILICCVVAYCTVFDLFVKETVFMLKSGACYKDVTSRIVNPTAWSSLASKLTFAYGLRQLRRASKKVLHLDDLYSYPLGHDCQGLALQYEDKLSRTATSSNPTGAGRTLINLTSLVIMPIAIVGCVRILGLCIDFYLILQFQQLLSFVAAADANTTWGMMLILRVVLLQTMRPLITAQWFYVTYYAGAQIKGLLSALLIKKYMAISHHHRRKANSEIMSYMTVDVHRTSLILSEGNWGLEGPMIMIPGGIILYQALGPSGLVGILFIAVILVVNAMVFKHCVLPQKRREMSVKNGRVHLLRDILRGIKVIKYYAWEEYFAKETNSKRATELSYLKKSFIMKSIGVTLAWVTPYLANALTVTVYVLSSPENGVTAERIFTSILVIQYIADTCTFTPHALYFVTQGFVSFKRIIDFLKDSSEDQHQPQDTSMDKPKIKGYNMQGKDSSEDQRYTVSMVGATLGWDPSSPILHNIDLVIARGELVAIIGKVGSGKSSMISALLGELNILSGTVSTSGTIAFVPQEPWIYNATLMENILLGQEYHHKRYKEVIEACALKQDLEHLPNSDQTEIGEHGTTLSGGQKQRVNLARALYSDADVYLLDDPLSAVDSKVGDHLFQHVLSPRGLIRGKTCVLVTHAIQYLPSVDKIVVIEDGRISERGTFNELMASENYLVKHLKSMDKTIKESGGYWTSSTPAILDRLSMNKKKSLMHDESTTLIQANLTSFLVYLRACGMWKCVLLVLISFSLAASTTANILWVGYWGSDWQTNATTALENTHFRLSVFCVLGIFQGALVALLIMTLVAMSLSASYKLHQNLLTRVLHIKSATFDYIPSGMILNRFTKDIDSIDSEILPNLWLLTYRISQAIGLIFQIILVVPFSLVPLIIMLIPAGIILVYFKRYITQVMRVDGAVKSPLFSYLNEMVEGAVSIRIYNRVNYFCTQFCWLVDDSTKTYWNFGAVKSTALVGTWVVAILFMLFVALICVYYRFSIDGSVAASCIFSIAQSMILIFMITRGASIMACTLVSVDRVTSLGDNVDMEEPWHSEIFASHVNWPTFGGITYRNYSARYQTSLDLVLKDVSFRIMPRERVGIVGRTGAGKSSLMASLFRMLETVQGSVLIDNVDISTIGLHDLRSRVTLITQDPVIFENSVRANLDPFSQYQDSDIWRALERAHLKDVLDDMADGLETLLGQEGGLLSVGQKQLLCLARALLRKSRILVLDEPTASVDVHTDELVQQTLRKHLSDCTIITIAHRINTIIDYDRVMVMEDGSIAEFDTPAVLLGNPDSKFSGLAKTSGMEINN